MRLTASVLSLLLAAQAKAPPVDPSDLCAYLGAPGQLSPPEVLERARAADRAAAAAAAARGAPTAGTRYLVAMRSIHIGSSWLTGMLRAHKSVGRAAREWWKAFRCCISPAAKELSLGGGPSAGAAQAAPALRGRSKSLAALNVSACNARADDAVGLWERSLAAWYEMSEAGVRRGMATGFKNQLPIDLTRPAALSGQPRCNALSQPAVRAYEREWWELMRRLRVRVVCLHRANSLARLLSNLLSRKERRENASLLLPIDENAALADAADELRFKQLCERGSRLAPVFWLGYEDLYLGDRQQRFDELAAFLDLERTQLKPAARVKRAPRDISTRIANTAALRARGGLLAQMLHPEFGVYNASQCLLHRPSTAMGTGVDERGPGSR